MKAIALIAASVAALSVAAGTAAAGSDWHWDLVGKGSDRNSESPWAHASGDAESPGRFQAVALSTRPGTLRWRVSCTANDASAFGEAREVNASRSGRRAVPAGRKLTVDLPAPLAAAMARGTVDNVWCLASATLSSPEGRPATATVWLKAGWFNGEEDMDGGCPYEVSTPLWWEYCAGP